MSLLLGADEGAMAIPMHFFSGNSRALNRRVQTNISELNENNGARKNG